MAIKTVFTVWKYGSGDMFKGYNDQVISDHLNERVANEVARMNDGYVNKEMDHLHPDYIAKLEEADRVLANAQVNIRLAAREMLSNGG